MEEEIKMVDPEILNRQTLPSLPHFYVIYLKSKSLYPAKYFIVTNRRIVETSFYIKSVGFWSNKHPILEEVENTEKTYDVSIPWGNIAYIESTQYKNR